MPSTHASFAFTPRKGTAAEGAANTTTSSASNHNTTGVRRPLWVHLVGSSLTSGLAAAFYALLQGGPGLANMSLAEHRRWKAIALESVSTTQCPNRSLPPVPSAAH